MIIYVNTSSPKFLDHQRFLPSASFFPGTYALSTAVLCWWIGPIGLPQSLPFASKSWSIMNSEIGWMHTLCHWLGENWRNVTLPPIKAMMLHAGNDPSESIRIHHLQFAFFPTSLGTWLLKPPLRGTCGRRISALRGPSDIVWRVVPKAAKMC